MTRKWYIFNHSSMWSFLSRYDLENLVCLLDPSPQYTDLLFLTTHETILHRVPRWLHVLFWQVPSICSLSFPRGLRWQTLVLLTIFNRCFTFIILCLALPFRFVFSLLRVSRSVFSLRPPKPTDPDVSWSPQM